MRLIKCSSISDAYYKGVRYVLENGVIKHIHGTNVLQADEVCLDIRVDNNIDFNSISQIRERAIAEYVENFLSPSKGDFTYTYGERIHKHDQLLKCVEKLQADINTRQAVIVIWDPTKDNEMEHAPCLQHIQFYLDSENELICKTLFRSQDFGDALLTNLNGIKHMYDIVCQNLGKRMYRIVLDSTCPHIYHYNVEIFRKALKL